MILRITEELACKWLQGATAIKLKFIANKLQKKCSCLSFSNDEGFQLLILIINEVPIDDY